MKYRITKDFLTFLEGDVLEFGTYSDGVFISVERTYCTHWYDNEMKEKRQAFSIQLKRPPVPTAALHMNKYSAAEWEQVTKEKVISDLMPFLEPIK